MQMLPSCPNDTPKLLQGTGDVVWNVNVCWGGRETVKGKQR
jgi:hypothetical protein